ncbi:uncharacterized protein TRAVEDRAFT_49311 [Trametes versicolor FP-101664 SS1]|uniref:uncharacterized protein n=1 Tax=Trametes versicolor (strain FP-101664) TaxID=717944 RepID=UPI000462369B|nr:uncharacterized protein TRAVEDRAFT_49311 [Trametes versicolor FP-101664 SS1]EIW56485.1 hypothetical protein TRAVEDRAFT_49311 [Trametes versicolor FP-101664 SS1]
MTLTEVSITNFKEIEVLVRKAHVVTCQVDHPLDHICTNIVVDFILRDATAKNKEAAPGAPIDP